MKKSTSIASCCLGNLLEWYDFGLFAILSPLFSKLFFPAYDSRTAMIATVGIFAIGFICRPIGALIFGYLGDTYGRAFTLRLSVLTVALPTLLIGILPTYETLGLFAPVLLVLVRIMQGVSIGGEYSGNLIYLIEVAPSKFRATFGALASMSANSGVLLAALTGVLMSAVFSASYLEQYAWRIPYIVSGLVCVFLYLFRLKIIETDVFSHLQSEKLLSRNPIKTTFQVHMPALLRALGLVCMGSSFYFFSFVYLPVFLAERQVFSTQEVSLLMSGLMLMMLIVTPLAGYLCDKIGRRRMFLWSAFLIILLIIPGYYLLHFNNTTLTIYVLALFTLLSSLEQGVTPATLVEHFPSMTRYTGLSVSYNVGNGILGGTLPMIAAWLSSFATQPSMAPAFYIVFWASITYFVVFFFIPKSINIIDLKK